MRIVHTVASLRSEHGGPSRSVTALCSALANLGHDVHLITTVTPGEGPPVWPTENVKVTRVPRPPSWRLFGTLGDDFTSAVAAAVGDEAAVIHDHGVWLPTNHAVARVARRMAIPRVVSVRGMLSHQALRQSRVQKALAWTAYQRRDLASARLLHATAEPELEDIRAMGLALPAVVSPNGVEMPGSRGRAPSSSDPSLGSRTALFLGRIHPMKGLLTLIDAWAALRPPGWQLVIAGPDEGGHEAQVRRAVSERGIDSLVTFPGPIDEADKWGVYARADLFVLPTLGENFGMVVAEALAAGVPVITTTAAPWRELEAERCGWWIDPGLDQLIRALSVATAITGVEREAMSIRARALVESRYAWPSIAATMTAAYERLLAGGPPRDRFDSAAAPLPSQRSGASRSPIQQ